MVLASHPGFPLSQSVPLERFVGPPLRAHAGGDVDIHEGQFGPRTVIPTHVHDVTVISLMLSGIASERVEQGNRLIATRDLIVTPAFAPHGYEFRKAGRWLNIQLSERWLARATDGHALAYERSEIVRSASAAAWTMRVREEMKRADSASSLAIDGALMLLVAEMSRTDMDAASTRPRWLRRVEEAIDESIADAPGIEALAAVAGVHPSHVLRTFRRYHGVTIANYVRRRRADLAREAMANSSRSLAEIAVQTGFADQAHLTRVFKQTFGETPGQYVRALRGR